MTKTQQSFLKNYKNDDFYKNSEHVVVLPTGIDELDSYIEKNKKEIMEYITDTTLNAIKKNKNTIALFKFENSGYVITIEKEYYDENLELAKDFFTKTFNGEYITKLSKYFDRLNKPNKEKISSYGKKNKTKKN